MLLESIFYKEKVYEKKTHHVGDKFANVCAVVCFCRV